jgi:hypothetical protein
VLASNLRNRTAYVGRYFSCHSYSAAVAKYFIEDQAVLCNLNQEDGREWTCNCVEFERRCLKFGHGFCVHIAVAIGIAIEEEKLMDTSCSLRFTE